jgi:peptide methionine sulfoxide reductase MsrA
MDEIAKLMNDKEYEAVVKYAFSAIGPLAGNKQVSDRAMQMIGQSFAYDSDIVESRDEHFRQAAEMIRTELIVKKWSES